MNMMSELNEQYSSSAPWLFLHFREYLYLFIYIYLRSFYYDSYYFIITVLFLCTFLHYWNDACWPEDTSYFCLLIRLNLLGVFVLFCY